MTITYIDSVSLHVASRAPASLEASSVTIHVASAAPVDMVTGSVLLHVASSYALAAANDCWVWDGSQEIPASVFVWDGSQEVPSSLEVV